MKRRLSESKQYTHGPVDEIFGQKPVLPLDTCDEVDGSFAVNQYLRTVRQEAMSDRVFYSVREWGKETGKKETGQKDQENHQIFVNSSYVQEMMTKLLQAKEPFKEEFQENEVSVDLENLDYENEAEELSGEISLIEENGETSLIEEKRETSLNEAESESTLTEAERKTPLTEAERKTPLTEAERKTPLTEAERKTPLTEAERKPPLTEAQKQSPLTEAKEMSDPIQINHYSIPQAAAKWREWVLSSPPPPLSWFYRLEHPTVIRLIILYTKWLSTSVPEFLSPWIFATFVRLDHAMDHTDIAQLRGLGFKAQKVYMASEDGTCARDTAIMVLSLLSQYYGQKDMVTIV